MPGRNFRRAAMTAGPRPTEEELAALRVRLVALKAEHHDLDDVIARVVATRIYDQIRLQRLKKRKLLLKDEIARLESRLLPDIIA
jgi:hypothetical protein